MCICARSRHVPPPPLVHPVVVRVRALLCQDVLGYNVTINTDAPGSGSVSGYYGVTGCRTPNNATDRGCMQGVPRWKSQTLMKSDAL